MYIELEIFEARNRYITVSPCMASETKYADPEDVLKRAAEVYPERKRIEWAVDYAQEDLEAMRPGRREDVRQELKMYLASVVGLGSYDDKVELPSDEEMRDIREALHEIVQSVLDEHPVHIGQYHATLELIPMNDAGRPILYNTGQHAMTNVELARYALATMIAQLWVEGHRIKCCPALKPRAKAGELCGRWFVGRRNQRFCSPRCQNRAGTRVSRKNREHACRRRLHTGPSPEA
jgi:hypothetical protein